MNRKFRRNSDLTVTKVWNLGIDDVILQKNTNPPCVVNEDESDWEAMKRTIWSIVTSKFFLIKSTCQDDRKFYFKKETHSCATKQEDTNTLNTSEWETSHVRSDDCKWGRLTGSLALVTKILERNSAFLAFWSKFSLVSRRYARVSCEDFAIVRD